MPTTGATETSPFVAANAVFRPAGFTGTITDDWASVPYCATDFAPYNNTATDHLATVHNPTRGIGDICRYMGDVDGATWRMPTAAEWDELYREQNNAGESAVLPNDGSGWVHGSFHPLSGRACGPRQNNVAIISNTQVENADPYTNGAVFLPASGHRNFTDGAIWWIGSCGFSWSSTASITENGHYMQFYSSTVIPQSSNSRAHALSIRCIRE